MFKKNTTILPAKHSSRTVEGIGKPSCLFNDFYACFESANLTTKQPKIIFSNVVETCKKNYSRKGQENIRVKICGFRQSLVHV